MVSPSSFDHLSYAAELLESQITPLDPVEWAKRRAGTDLWSKQREISMSVVNNKLTAVKSGHGVGKSFTTSTLATWWIDTHPPDDTMVISTAPSSRQVSAIMWEEIRKIHRRANLAGEVQRSDRWLINDIEVGFGRKPQDYDKHAFQGLHRKYVLIIIDEACGVDEWLWIAALSMATGPHCRIIAIGNPDDPSSYFAKVCKPGSGWNVIKISVFDSPNFTDEEVSQETADKLTGRDWVEYMEREVGRGTPTWVSKVEGEFPDIDENSVIPLRWVHEAQERWKEWEASGKHLPPDARYILGCDIARFGGDKNAVAHKHGSIVTSVDLSPGGDTERTADRIAIQMANRHNAVAVIDTNGVGAGVYDKLKRRRRRCIPVNVANRTSTTDKTGQIQFYNVRAHATWLLREALDPSRGATLALPPEEQLAADLSAPRWKTMAGGKIVIEEKSEVKKRIGRSPDRGDAVILANFVGSTTAFGSDSSSFDWVDLNEEDYEGADLEDVAIPWDEGEDDWRMIARV